jgi:hypothetical protein
MGYWDSKRRPSLFVSFLDNYNAQGALKWPNITLP